MATTDLDLGRYKLGWNDAEEYVYKPAKGLSEAVVKDISWMKGEPQWMTDFRLRAFRHFERKPMAPWFAANMPDLDFDDIYYYIKPTDHQVSEWDELPEQMRATYQKLGIPEAEQRYFAGVTAQYECLRGSTRVWTTSGMRSIKELVAGDRVFSLDETTRNIEVSTVVGHASSGEKEVFEIRARGAVIGASANHPFLVLRDERKEGRLRRRYAARWVPVEELQEGDLVAIATDLPEFGRPAVMARPTRAGGDVLPLTTTDDLCWWAGLYLGDGYLHHRGEYTALEIAIDPSDTELVAEIQRVTLELFGIEMRVATDGLRLVGRGTAALCDYVELNGLGGTAHTKRIPDWAFGLPRSQRLSFLAGLRMAVPEMALADDIADLAALTVPNPDGVVDDTDFTAHTSDMMGFVRIDSITSAGVEETYDIEVEGHHNFVAEGFIVHNSEVVYHRNREDLEAQGILFCDMDTAVREYPDLVRQYFATVIPPGDNKFASLNSAVWSGGSFIYIPPGVECEMPLQAYFRINSENAGQFERTLIIADEGAKVHYIEGCSAPVYSSDSLHSAVVELIAKPSARITYTTIQNWSPNVYNLVTKRAVAEEEAHVEWIDGNIGSRLTMKYPSVVLKGRKASGEVLSVAYAGPGQHQDAGAKMIHSAPETTSTIVSKSISKDGGVTTYRGLVHVDEGATGSKSFVRCDALLLDDISTSKTKPYMEIEENDAEIGHEASVSKVGEDQLFYLMSRGLSEQQAMGMIVNGFIEPITRTLPMEYAVEWSRLIELQMEGSVG
ncbi:MAG TPA: Fe-S cluster assembly protein SufB [Acidimicrobiales bacterium]|nr:Fe-S cluster assembly protein SufB [Acidimicrobiales bacterium]